jgi:hypothetical protein
MGRLPIKKEHFIMGVGVFVIPLLTGSGMSFNMSSRISVLSREGGTGTAMFRMMSIVLFKKVIVEEDSLVLFEGGQDCKKDSIIIVYVDIYTMIIFIFLLIWYSS